MTYHRIDLVGGGQEVILADQEYKLNAYGVLSVYDSEGRLLRAYSPNGWRKLQAADE